MMSIAFTASAQSTLRVLREAELLLDGQPRAAAPQIHKLVAAGLVLRRYQDQARAGRLRLRVAAKGVQDADDCSVRGENAQANGRDDCQEEDDGHNKRDHDRPTLKTQNRLRLSILTLLPERESPI